MKGVAAQLEKAYPKENGGFSLVVVGHAGYPKHLQAALRIFLLMLVSIGAVITGDCLCKCW